MPRRTDLVLAPTQPLAELVERAQAYTVDARATSTRKAYLTDFASFEAWCSKQGLPAAPTTPAAVAVYLAALADAGRKAHPSQGHRIFPSRRTLAVATWRVT